MKLTAYILNPLQKQEVSFQLICFPGFRMKVRASFKSVCGYSTQEVAYTCFVLIKTCSGFFDSLGLTALMYWTEYMIVYLFRSTFIICLIIQLTYMS